MKATNQVMMMMISQKNLFIIFMLFWALLSNNETSAQNTDFKLRLSSKIQKEINKKSKVGIEYEHRFDQYLTTFDKAFLEPSFSYDISKNLRAGLAYRVMYDQNKTRKRSFEQRIAGYIRYDFKIDDFKIKVKSGLQYGFDDLTYVTFNYKQKFISRNTLELEYNWFGSKFTPFASYELFYHINNSHGGVFNQWRLKAGTSYDVSKRSSLSVYYLFENEFNVAFPSDSHVLGAGYSYSF